MHSAAVRCGSSFPAKQPACRVLRVSLLATGSVLAPPALYRAQGFPAHYIIKEIPDPDPLLVDGKQTMPSPLNLPRPR